MLAFLVLALAAAAPALPPQIPAVLARAAAAAAASVAAPQQLPPPTLFPLSAPRLAVLGAAPPARGIFDPSLIPTGNAQFPFALAYSAVHSTANISTRLAVFDAAAGAYVHAAAANAAAGPGPFPCAAAPQPPCTASLVHEVSTLLADAADPDPAARIKVLAHSYLVVQPGDQLQYALGHISLHTAPSLAGPFTGRPLLGWASPSPLSTANVSQVLTALPQLADCLAFSEPGALAVAGGRLLLLALTCISLPDPAAPAHIRVELLGSADHGASWQYRGLAVDGTEAPALGNYTVPQLSAPDLFVDAASNATYLSVTPAAPLWQGFVGYSGCIVLRLTPDLAGVVRDAGSGQPVVQRVILPSGVAFCGACSAASGGSAGNYMAPVLQQDGVFTIALTGIAAD